MSEKRKVVVRQDKEMAEEISAESVEIFLETDFLEIIFSFQMGDPSQLQTKPTLL